jgi:ion channel-forming bestrophin family protein
VTVELMANCCAYRLTFHSEVRIQTDFDRILSAFDKDLESNEIYYFLNFQLVLGASMYVRREISPGVIWHFAWKSIIFFTVLSCLAVLAYTEFNIHLLSIPFLPVATVGTAVAFYAGFKNNASYERLWEGRKIWAEVEHLCRYAAMIVLKSSKPGVPVSPARKQFVYGLIVWTNALRGHLRRIPTFFGDDSGERVQALLLKDHDGILLFEEDMMQSMLPVYSESEAREFLGKANLPAAILFKQMVMLDSLKNDDELSEPDYIKLLDLMELCSQQASAAERLNNFPFPRQYAHFSSLFVKIFVVLLPFALLTELKTAGVNLWLTVPFSVLISWVFFTMERVGDTSENPFENALNDVPLSTICRHIEIDLKSMLGEKELPSPLQPQKYVML